MHIINGACYGNDIIFEMDRCEEGYTAMEMERSEEDAMESVCSQRSVRQGTANKHVPFAEHCQQIKMFLQSPEYDRWYPPNVQHKHDKQNFRRKASYYKWDDTRQKLFHSHTDALGFGEYFPVVL